LFTQVAAGWCPEWDTSRKIIKQSKKVQSIKLYPVATENHQTDHSKLIPKFAGSNPAKAVGFLWRKNPLHVFLQRGSKAVCPMSQIFSMLKTPGNYVEVEFSG